MNLNEARDVARDLLWVRNCNYKYQIKDREPLYCAKSIDDCKYRLFDASTEIPECQYFSVLEEAVVVMKNKCGVLK